MSFLPPFDRPIVGRIRECLRQISSEEITEYLQTKFPSDYGRRKRNAFSKLVRQVHQTVVDGNELKTNDGGGSKDQLRSKRRKLANEKDVGSTSDFKREETMVEYTDTNALNSSVISLYKKTKRTSVSAPASSAPIFTYIDRPMVPGNVMLVEKQRETNDHDTSDFNASKDTVSTGSKTGTALDTISALNTNKSMSSNVAVSSETLISAKKRKKDKPLKHDYEITGEKSKSRFNLKKSDLKLKDIAMNKDTLHELLMCLVHFNNPTFDKDVGVVPRRGLLLHGPTGCGKSLLANAIAGQLDMPMLKIVCSEIFTGVSGESEATIRDIFELAAASAPCVIFFDEIDAIAQKREDASKDMERRIVSQLLTCFDDLCKSPSQILVVGATSRPDSIDLALRRDGRFSKEIRLGIPNEKDREDILRLLCKNMQLEPNFNFALVARLTPGYVGADLVSLCFAAAESLLGRVLGTEDNMKVQIREDVDNHAYSCPSAVSPLEINSNLKSTTPSESSKFPKVTCNDLFHVLAQGNMFPEGVQQCIEFVDFETALTKVQPTAKREGFVTVPKVTWDDIGALEDIRDELRMAILAPLRIPHIVSDLCWKPPHGILLAGPPGCGKTLVAKATANEAGINFMSVKPSDILDKFVGESEKNVEKCFQTARNLSPCVLFFDEFDALVPARGGDESTHTSRVVDMMLTEMAGLSDRGKVFVLAATNRPDAIDPAMLRPGRIDKSLYVGLPDADDRATILKTITKNGTEPKISNLVSLDAIARDERCERFTGADLGRLVSEAGSNILRRYCSRKGVIGRKGIASSDIRLSPEHFELSTEYFELSPEDSKYSSEDSKYSPEDFEQAWKKVKPSVSLADELRYKEMSRKLGIQ